MTGPHYAEAVRVHVITYNRPAICARLLDDIAREMPGCKVRVFDDASTVDMTPVRQRCERPGWRFWQAWRNHGVRGYWRMVDATHRCLLEDDVFQFVVQLDDDFRLCDDFWSRLIQRWNEIEDPSKIALNLLNDGRHQCWTGIVAQPLNDDVERVGWVDGGFLVPRAYFEALDYQAPLVPQDWWARGQRRGTGVYRYISQHLLGRGHTMYRVRQSHVVHADGRQSVMHPKIRGQQPLQTMAYIDGEDRARALEREAHDRTVPLPRP